jgi:hypothetical protein
MDRIAFASAAGQGRPFLPCGWAGQSFAATLHGLPPLSEGKPSFASVSRANRGCGAYALTAPSVTQPPIERWPSCPAAGAIDQPGNRLAAVSAAAGYGVTEPRSRPPGTRQEQPLPIQEA